MWEALRDSARKPGISRDELLEQLKGIAAREDDAEENHLQADDLLLSYINDTEIAHAFDAIKKWYA